MLLLEISSVISSQIMGLFSFESDTVIFDLNSATLEDTSVILEINSVQPVILIQETKSVILETNLVLLCHIEGYFSHKQSFQRQNPT